MAMQRFGCNVIELDQDGRVEKTVAIRCYPGIRVAFYEVITDTCVPGAQSTVVTGIVDIGEYDIFLQRVMDLAASASFTPDNPATDRICHVLVLDDDVKPVVDLPISRIEKDVAKSLMCLVESSFVGDAFIVATRKE